MMQETFLISLQVAQLQAIIVDCVNACLNVRGTATRQQPPTKPVTAPQQPKNPKISIAEPNIGDIRPPGGIPEDQRSKSRMKAFISGNERLIREENAKHWLFVVLLWAAGIAFVFVLFAKVWHLVCSDSYVWLNKSRLDGLNEFLTNSVIGGTVTTIFRSKFKSNESK